MSSNDFRRGAEARGRRSGVRLLSATVAVLATVSLLPSTGGAQATKVVKIGVIAPLSGDLTATGTGIRNSVDLAIRQPFHIRAKAGRAGQIQQARLLGSTKILLQPAQPPPGHSP